MNKEQNKFYFNSSSQLQYFNQFKLSNSAFVALNKSINKQQFQNKNNKIKALIQGCIKRNNKLLYRGNKHFYNDIQYILDNYSQQSQKRIIRDIMKTFNIQINKSENKVLNQCNNCANFTAQWKYCPQCQHIHYCHEGCQMKNKFTHERQQCKSRPFPRTYRALQVQLHVGSDLGKNVYVCFQHQVSMSLLIRGQQLLETIYQYFTEKQGRKYSQNYQVKLQNKMVKFQQQTKDYITGQQKVNIQTIQQICQIYRNNNILHQLQLFLLENGAILNKIIKEVHDNHIKEIFIFNFP